MKRIITIILILTLIFSMLQYPATASSDVCFIAINETLLDLGTTPYFYGSIYVPYSIFSNFAIYTAYFASGNTVSLYRQDRQLYFDMNSSHVYDQDDNYYNTAIVKSGGELYVSVQLVASFFGLKWSYIEGVGYGDILRITDGGSYMSDSAFLNAATSLMQSRYESYKGSITAVPTDKPTTTPEPINPTDDTNGSISSVYISFEGVPDGAFLEKLSAYSTRATFYMTPNEIYENPDMARRIVGEGHMLGINCSKNFAEDYARGARLLFDATGYRTIMITAKPENMADCRSFAKENGLSVGSVELNLSNGYSYTQMTNLIENINGTTHIRMSCSEQTRNYLSTLLTLLRNGDYYLIQERER